MSAFPQLFAPASLGRMNAKNRLVMPPMVLNYADARGRVTDRYLAHIERVARGGIGTMVLEASYVSEDGKGFACQLGIHSDDCLAGLRQLADAAHAHGALIGPQLYHAGRQSSAKITGTQLLAPSPLPCPLMQEVPREMSEQDIERVVAQFAAAAKRARAAGFDFVEIHGAHGYLLMQFLSAFSNQRKDEYGGSLENRLRFPLAVVRAVRDAVGPEFTVLYRISGEEGIPGGLTLEETMVAAKALEDAGVDALHVSVGSYGSYVQGRMIPPMSMPDGVNAGLAAGIRKQVSIPVIAVGKCREPDLAETLLKEDKADFVAIGRSLLADPDWPSKASEGRAEDINHCIACNQGCISRLFDQQDVWCTVNPECGREREFEMLAGQPGKGLKIAVIGAGPGGLTAALTAVRAGAEVTVFEREQQTGGQLPAAAAAPHRDDWRNFEHWLEREVAKHSIDMHVGETAHAERIKALRPDMVVVATGARPVRADFGSVANTQVMNARDVLEGRVRAHGRVVVVGGGCSGVQTAEFLAERGHAVSIVEAGGDIATDMPVDERHLALSRLHEMNVDLRTGQRLLRVSEEGVELHGPRGNESLPADTVLLCLGSESEDELVDELMRYGLNVATVGDARRPRKVTDAVAEAANSVLYFLADRTQADMPRHP